MSENLNKRPPKGILKQSSSFDCQGKRCSVTSLGSTTTTTTTSELVEEENRAEHEHDHEEVENQTQNSERKKSTKFDEQNILQTLHPPDKDYGFMKIEEPKTPFNYYEEEDHEGESSRKQIDPVELAERIGETKERRFFGGEEEGEQEDGDSEGKGRIFESKRKAHYNEYFAVKLARQLMEKEQEDEESGDSDSGAKKFIPREECSSNNAAGE